MAEGALRLRQIDRQDGISEAFSRCFIDQRDPRYCDHTLRELFAQRLLALALGYEDLNDHDPLRADPLLALSVGKSNSRSEKIVYTTATRLWPVRPHSTASKWAPSVNPNTIRFTPIFPLYRKRSSQFLG